jgi:hypothetical protein
MQIAHSKVDFSSSRKSFGILQNIVRCIKVLSFISMSQSESRRSTILRSSGEQNLNLSYKSEYLGSCLFRVTYFLRIAEPTCYIDVHSMEGVSRSSSHYFKIALKQIL